MTWIRIGIDTCEPNEREGELAWKADKALTTDLKVLLLFAHAAVEFRLAIL